MENKKRKRRRKGSRRRRKIQLIKRITLFVGIVLVLCLGANTVRNKVNDWKAQKAAEEEERLAKEAEAAEKALIEEVLSEEEYEDELRELYETYPQMKKVFLNREDYPDWLVEYMVNHEEVINWGVDYPEYMTKSEEELEEVALEPIEQSYEERNNIPMLFQWDKRWGYLSYGSGQIAIEGCGPVCLSMAAIGVTGDGSITPKVVADFSMENGYYVEGQGTGWNLMSDGAEEMGLSSYQITEWKTYAIKEQLEAGNPIICSMGPGDFTTQGHFIVLVKLNEDGTVMVNDPNSLKNSEKSWEISVLLEQIKGMWAISAN